MDIDSVLKNLSPILDSRRWWSQPPSRSFIFTSQLHSAGFTSSSSTITYFPFYRVKSERIWTKASYFVPWCHDGALCSKKRLPNLNKERTHRLYACMVQLKLATQCCCHHGILFTTSGISIATMDTYSVSLASRQSVTRIPGAHSCQHGKENTKIFPMGLTLRFPSNRTSSQKARLLHRKELDDAAMLQLTQSNK